VRLQRRHCAGERLPKAQSVAAPEPPGKLLRNSGTRTPLPEILMRTRGLRTDEDATSETTCAMPSQETLDKNTLSLELFQGEYTLEIHLKRKPTWGLSSHSGANALEPRLSSAAPYNSVARGGNTGAVEYLSHSGTNEGTQSVCHIGLLVTNIRLKIMFQTVVFP